MLKIRYSFIGTLHQVFELNLNILGFFKESYNLFK